jgi:hypothetical protein
MASLEYQRFLDSMIIGYMQWHDGDVRSGSKKPWSLYLNPYIPLLQWPLAQKLVCIYTERIY